MNPRAWQGMKYPDSDVVGLVHRHARPGRDVPAGALALDVGCGPGRHVRLLSELGYRAVGLDSDPEMVAVAQGNGVEAVLASAADYRPAEPPALALCWGFMMLVADGPALIAGWQPALVIADWRSPRNDCFQWPGNEPQPGGGRRLHHPGHTLHGQVYFAHELDQCELPGYERVHHQIVTRATPTDRHEWIQTVHRRR